MLPSLPYSVGRSPSSRLPESGPSVPRLHESRGAAMSESQHLSISASINTQYSGPQHTTRTNPSKLQNDPITTTAPSDVSAYITPTATPAAAFLSAARRHFVMRHAACVICPPPLVVKRDSQLLRANAWTDTRKSQVIVIDGMLQV